MRTTTTRGKLTLLFMVFAMLLALPATAFADLVKNEVANGIGSEKTVTVGDTTDIKYWIHKTANTCDAAGATVYLKVTGGQSGDVTFTQSRSFTGCDEVNAKIFSFTANKAGTYTVEVDRVVDSTAGDGYSWGPAAFTLKAGEAAPPPPPPNDAPTVANDAGDVFANEGSTLQNSGSFSDANGDALTITKTAGAGTLTQGANGSWSWSLATTDNGSGSVTVTADDGKGGTVSDSFNWSASNVAPTADLTAPNAVNEGGSFNVSLGNVQDPGSADTFEYRFDCGSGYGPWGSASSASCAAGDGPGSLGVKGEVKDNDGGTNEYTASVTVDNVAPTATKSFASSVNEGTSFNLSLTNPSDPSAADTAAGFTYAFDCGDGNGYGAFGTSASAACPTDDNGTRTVGAKIRDKDGAVSTYTGSVTVNNVAPSVTLSGPANVTENQNVNRTYTFSINDPGTADTHTVDGTSCGANGTKVSETASSIDCNFPDGTKTSVVSASVSDDDGASGSDSKTVSIANVAPVLSNLQIMGASQTACLTGGNNVSISFDVTDPGADGFTRSVNWGDGNTDALLSHNYASAGSYLIEVGGTDGEDNAATLAASNRVSLTYSMSTSLLAPVNLNGTSIFKYGSTIPMKIKIVDCANNPVSGLNPSIQIVKLSADAPSGEINEPTNSTSGADTTGFMRYDSTNGQYIYNLATKFLTDPQATYRAVIGEGSSTPNPMKSQTFGLKK